MYRKTFAKINLDNLNYNLQNLKNYHNNYKYIFGVVKANGYNHGDIEISRELLKNNINYLAVSSIDEALNIRKKIKK